MCHINKRLFILFAPIGIFLPLVTVTAVALEAYPVLKTGYCPIGYHQSGNYCAPNGKASGAAIEKDGFCPQGYHASGNYCVANSPSSGKAVAKNGFCPSGYHASGSYCVQN